MTDQQRTNRPEDRERGFGMDPERERDIQRAGQRDPLERDDRNIHEGVQTDRERSGSRSQEGMRGREGRESAGREEADPRRGNEEERELGGRTGRTSQQPDVSDQPLNAPARPDGGFGRGSGFDDEEIARRASGRELEEAEDLPAWYEEEDREEEELL